jgi:hypothetical protein
MTITRAIMQEYRGRFIDRDPFFVPSCPEVEGHIDELASNIYNNPYKRRDRTPEQCRRDAKNVILEFGMATEDRVIMNPEPYRDHVAHSVAYDTIELDHGSTIDCKKISWWGEKLLLQKLSSWKTFRKHDDIIDLAAFGSYRNVKNGYEVTFEALVSAKALFNGMYGTTVIQRYFSQPSWVFDIKKAARDGWAVYKE